MTVLSLVMTLCPCLVCAQMSADDCCASDGPTIAGVCCAEDGSARTAVPSTTVFVPAAATAATQATLIDMAVPMPVHALAIPDRPIVARAILRI